MKGKKNEKILPISFHPIELSSKWHRMAPPAFED